MPDPLLEEVFKLSGSPTYTFVRPLEYAKLLIALRSPGRGVVIEGPSGIGKTTAVTRALEELGLAERVLRLSARRKQDRELIGELPEMNDIGIVIVDDFHRLDEEVRRQVADYLKVLADEEDPKSKLIVVGINRAGASLIRFAHDLVNRIDTIRFEANPDERVREVIAKGEKALNIAMPICDEIVEGANGSFYIAQMLSHETCIAADIMEASHDLVRTSVSYQVVLGRVMDRLGDAFMQTASDFARGSKLRREGRAPYLHMLKWLAEAEEWSIDLERAAALDTKLKGSVTQVVEKGFLATLLKDENIGALLHFDSETKVLAVEDPQFVFFIRNLAWQKFAERIGYLTLEFDSTYDFALSFSGKERELAAMICAYLEEQEFEVFYDKNEEHRILAENIEDYLGPIYRSEATYIIALLSDDYPTRIWTKFESKQFKHRFGSKSVIPVWFSNVSPSAFGEDQVTGGLVVNVAAARMDEAKRLAGVIANKLKARKLSQ
jgi:hypothetical protein